MQTITLVLGGTRSGKSRRGEELALASGLPVIYVATYPQSSDLEMNERIAKHRRERAAQVRTVEQRYDLAELASEHRGSCLLLDCLTLWLYVKMNEGLTDAAILEELRRGVEQADASWVVVSSEVGLGIVPADAESRRFRDLSGSAHQVLGSLAQQVELMVAGIALRVK